MIKKIKDAFKKATDWIVGQYNKFNK